MASWIVHLRIAEQLLADLEGLAPSAFAIGNIAPDSGIPNEAWETFDPPAAVTHFKSTSAGGYKIDDLRFYQGYLLKEELRENPERYSFLLGYFFHLVTDNYWGERIGTPTRERYAQEFEADPEFIWEVKKDWYGLDFIYVRDHPDSLFWKVFLQSDMRESPLDFLPVEALHHRIDEIKENYQRKDEKIHALYERPYIYLSKDEMDAFVQDVSRALGEIYRYLTENRGDISGYSSALELPLFTG